MRIRFGTVACLAALALAAGPAALGQKVLLKDVSAAGDTSKSDGTVGTTVTIKATPPGQAEQSVVLKHNEHEAYTQQVLASDGSRPTALRRTYTVSDTTDSGPQGNGTKPTSLQGKTVTVKRFGDKITVSVDKGTLEPADTKKMQDLVKSGRIRFMPGREVEVGEEWTIDPEAAKREFEGADSVVTKCKLAGIEDHNGHRSARITLTLDLSGKMGNSPVPMHVQLSGTGWYALDLQRTTDLDMTGPMTGTGEVEQGGAKMPYSLDGTLTIHETETWSHVGK